jgi:hypothetical protein
MVKSKDKVIPLLKQHVMKGFKEEEAQLHIFLTSINNAYEADCIPRGSLKAT